jgi:hypothetical protein
MLCRPAARPRLGRGPSRRRSAPPPPMIPTGRARPLHARPCPLGLGVGPLLRASEPWTRTAAMVEDNVDIVVSISKAMTSVQMK